MLLKNLPLFESYGQYSSSNYGVNTLLFTIKGIDIYFSYETPVAFDGKHGLVVRVNDWSNTTGKHLNWIDGGNKKARVDSKTFEKKLKEALKDL